MKLERNQVVMVAVGGVVVLALTFGSWLMVSSGKRSVSPVTTSKPTPAAAQQTASSDVSSAPTKETVDSDNADVLDAAALVPVTSKAEADKALGDLDGMVNSAGNEAE
ncbi:MAG TPA: hypothetical protein VN420_04830 [Candidatus Fimivivens sp.]|nr:hypothetical protein [Candidatus Fimivivens sp.]